MYGLSELTLEHRQQIAKNVRTQLEIERADAIEKNNTVLLKEIDKKLLSIDAIYRLSEVENDNSK